MQIIVGLKCKEVSEKGCLLSLLCHLFIIYFCFLINGIAMKIGQYL